MHTRRFFVTIALSGVVSQMGFLPLIPARAQDAPPKKQARIIIRTPDGEQVIDLDPNDLPDMGDENQIFAVKVGPDGKVTTMNGKSGMFNGPDGIQIVGPNGVKGLKNIEIVDPGKSYLLPLLKREDVQAQLFLSPRQREALDALEKGQQQALQQQLQQSALPKPGEIAGKSKEELRAFFTERVTKMREDMQALNSDRDKKMTAILTPTQAVRLKELDFQWRGPLAMGVKNVAEQVKLTPQQTPVVTDLLKKYQQEANQRLRMGSRSVQLNHKFNEGSSDAPPTFAEMQAYMENAAKEIESKRKALGDKALNTISSEQKTQWSALTGKPFVFRS